MRIVLIMAALLPIAAQAATPNQRAEAEARSFFIACPQTPKDRQISCLGEQERFAASYVLAKAGELSDMMDLAMTFDPDVMPGKQPQPALGVRHDKIQGCAWRVVRTQTEPDPLIRPDYQDMADRHCVPFLSPNGLQAATDRANDLLYELRHSPATPPPEQPFRPDPKHPLDSTVVPLHP